MAAKTIYDLDDYCLSTIFEYPALDDWMNLSLTTKRFKQNVNEFVIPRQVIYVAFENDFRSAKDLFQTFGKHMTKIAWQRTCIYHNRNNPPEPNPHQTKYIFEIFLQMLLDHCEPGKLKEVTIWCDEQIQRDPINPDLLTRTATYFENVTSLKNRISV